MLCFSVDKANRIVVNDFILVSMMIIFSLFSRFSSWIKEIIIIKVILFLLLEFDLVIRVKLIISLIKVLTEVDTLRYAYISIFFILIIFISSLKIRRLFKYGRLASKVVLIIYQELSKVSFIRLFLLLLLLLLLMLLLWYLILNSLSSLKLRLSWHSSLGVVESSTSITVIEVYIKLIFLCLADWPLH